ncbi:sugar ABC transporter permease [Acrocarpospora sp. B8E8]|uniref:carbohydrate ABC transporter permease n=1 Tax=Acrocarpospora sp. B8E8 TaxID=3153572 RepID=UPI00325CFFC0
MADTAVARPPADASAASAGDPGKSRRRREALNGYLFVGPSVIGFLVFILGPLLAVIYFSFTRYDAISPPQWRGLANFERLFTDDRLREAYLNTLIYVAAAVILINGIALLLAVLINQRLPKPLTLIFRSVYFFPSLVSLVYVSLIWQALFQRDTGLVNYYLDTVGGDPVNWLNSTSTSRWTVVIVDTWRNVGFAMLIYVAALQDVPKALTEAARLDGAGVITLFRRIIVPMISQAIFFNVTITVIGAFQIYESVIVLTSGGPGDSTRSVVMYLAEQAFSSFQVGYASAIAITLFLIILAATLIQFRIRRSWVHYE